MGEHQDEIEVKECSLEGYVWLKNHDDNSMQMVRIDSLPRKLRKRVLRALKTSQPSEVIMKATLNHLVTVYGKDALAQGMHDIGVIRLVDKPVREEVSNA